MYMGNACPLWKTEGDPRHLLGNRSNAPVRRHYHQQGLAGLRLVKPPA